MAHNVTVDIVSEIDSKNGSKTVKSDQNSSLNLNSSTNCEECCRSCSCGEMPSSLEDSTSDANEVIEESENNELLGAKQKPIVTKTTIATQTPNST